MSIRAQHAAPEPRCRAAHRILAVDTEPDMLRLLEEWLAGCDVTAEGPTPASGRFDAIVVDVPFPRRGGLHVLDRLAREYPAASVLVMSSSFFADVRSDGGVARALRVAGVLPKPFTRDALLGAMTRALSPDA